MTVHVFAVAVADDLLPVPPTLDLGEPPDHIRVAGSGKAIDAVALRFQGKSAGALAPWRAVETRS
jgi:hypothetical protein